jgi:hypothetical protein
MREAWILWGALVLGLLATLAMQCPAKDVP